MRHLRRCLASIPRLPNDGKLLGDFLNGSTQSALRALHDLSIESSQSPFAIPNADGRTFFLETYGCQMNVSDSEIVHSLLKQSGYVRVDNVEEADVMLVNTCSIRDKAEERVWNRLRELKAISRKKEGSTIAVLGCMAERLKSDLLEREKLVDVVVGPDAYRDLPRLLMNAVELGEKGLNVQLSLEETYADVAPVRQDEHGVSAFVSIMRGCNNMCSYCIVPFTRGRERSRDVDTIVEEVRHLARQGVKEITLLGQNVNSYNFLGQRDNTADSVELSKGFRSIVKIPAGGVRFAHLLEQVAKAAPESRIRFTSPHPKDFPDEVLQVIKQYPNVCKMIHIPAQSGSSQVLERMRRGYSRESYIELIDHIRNVLPNVSLSSDFISGFCGETEDEHLETLSLLERVQYDQAFMFAYSQREKTHAHRRYPDDVPVEVKSRRLQEVIGTYNRIGKAKAERQVGQVQLVLVERVSKRNSEEFSGRNEASKPVILSSRTCSEEPNSTIEIGDFVAVRIESGTQLHMRGRPLFRTTLSEFYKGQSGFSGVSVGQTVRRVEVGQ